MKYLNDEQRELLGSMGMPQSFDGLTDDELILIEDALANELQLHGLNDAGDGLSAHGELCRSIIVSLPG